MIGTSFIPLRLPHMPVPGKPVEKRSGRRYTKARSLPKSRTGKIQAKGKKAMNDTTVKQAIEEFKEMVRSLYGPRLRGIVLYGSWARGDATEDSDIDLLVIIDGPIVPGKEIDRMLDISTDLDLKYGILLSVYPVSASDYLTVNSPLLLNVRREGLAV